MAKIKACQYCGTKVSGSGKTLNGKTVLDHESMCKFNPDRIDTSQPAPESCEEDDGEEIEHGRMWIETTDSTGFYVPF